MAAATAQIAKDAIKASLACASVAKAAPKYAKEHRDPQINRMILGPTASAKRPPTRVPKMAKAAKVEKSWPTSAGAASKTSFATVGSKLILQAVPA